MHFFMPQEFTDNNADFRSLSVVISMTADKIVDDQFLFTNKVWDELLKEMEEGATNSDEILTSKDTMKKIFTALVVVLSFSHLAMAQNKYPDPQVAANKASFPIKMTDAQWKAKLTPAQYYILREQGTERSGSGKYDHFFKKAP